MKRYILAITACMLCLFSTKSYCDCPPGGGNPNHQHHDDPQKHKEDEAESTEQRSFDPNELLGPAGYDTLRWVSINDVLNYTIFFENDPSFATAPAQAVDVRFRLPERQMTNSFVIGEYGFANQAFKEGIGGSFCRTRLDLRDSMNLYVDVLAGLDVEKGDAFWHFSSIDPVSGYAIYEADRGMLPVNDTTHVGEGFVTFSLRPAATMQTGDTLSLMAKILFDQNDTIPTNHWCNRIDAGAPTSQIFAQQDEQNPLLYHLSFIAQDDNGGCGVKHIILYAADYLGVWQEVGTYPADTTMDYFIEQGQSCPLMAVAEDYVGNHEAFKEQPDVVLNNVLPPTGLTLSNTHFNDDLSVGAYIATLSTVGAKDGESFVYALAEGDGAIHNDFFTVSGDQLLLNESLRCVDNTEYQIRLSTTNAGGKTYSEAFTLTMEYVLLRPQTDTISITLCEGESFLFHDVSYAQAGSFSLSFPNDNMCDSTFLLQLTILPLPQKPEITLLNDTILMSSAATGNQWYHNGELIQGAVEQNWIPVEPGTYSVQTDNGHCLSALSDIFTVHPTYFITVQSSNDAFGETSGTGEYPFREQVNISATAYDGYHFVTWEDGIETAERTILVGASDATYIARFEEEGPYTGIDNSAIHDWTVYCESLTLYVSDPQGSPYYVWSSNGKLIYYGTASKIDLPIEGSYLVKLGDSTRKVVTQ